MGTQTAQRESKMCEFIMPPYFHLSPILCSLSVKVDLRQILRLKFYLTGGMDVPTADRDHPWRREINVILCFTNLGALAHAIASLLGCYL